MARRKKFHGLLAQISESRTEIMGFAALCIIFFHEWITVSDGLAAKPGLSLIYTLEVYLKRFGFFGVDIFFLLSGIGLTFAIAKSGTLRFYYNRFKRVYIPFLAVGIGRALTEHWTAAQFIGNVTGWNFFTKSMYSFLWFVPAIMTFYLVFPLYYKIFSFAPHKGIFTAAVIALWLFASVMFRDIMREDLFGFTNRIPVFLIGIYMGYLTKEKKSIELKWYHWLLVTFMFCLGFYLAVLANFHDKYILVPVSNSFLPNLLMSVSIIMLLAKLFNIFSKSAIGRGVKHFFGFFGMFSLEFYCVQEWFGGLLIPKLYGIMPNILINCCVLAAAAAGGLILYYFQKGFWKLIDRNGSGRQLKK